MEIYLNELSIHRQFHDVPSFRDAFVRLTELRKVARRFGHDMHSPRTILTAEPLRGVSMQHSLGKFRESERRAAQIWLTKGGPFWDEQREHGADDWLECRDEVVTDHAIGEAAYRKLRGVECGLASVRPSDWEYSPVEVVWRRGAEGLEDLTVSIANWRDVDALERSLREIPPSIRSWTDLKDVSARRFEKLVFSDRCFTPLDHTPFRRAAASQFLDLLEVLDRLTNAYDETGARTNEGHRIYRTHFTGDRAKFSDSSDTEKQRYKRELTFHHPRNRTDSLFCTWHGKLRGANLPLRLHFSWPVRAGEPIYVVYAGPKITRR